MADLNNVKEIALRNTEQNWKLLERYI